MTYILWSSHFTSYLEDYLMEKRCTWDNGSLWLKDRPCKIYVGQWPIFHGPLILPYIIVRLKLFLYVKKWHWPGVFVPLWALALVWIFFKRLTYILRKSVHRLLSSVYNISARVCQWGHSFAKYLEGNYYLAFWKYIVLNSESVSWSLFTQGFQSSSELEQMHINCLDDVF